MTYDAEAKRAWMKQRTPEKQARDSARQRERRTEVRKSVSVDEHKLIAACNAVTNVSAAKVLRIIVTYLTAPAGGATIERSIVDGTATEAYRNKIRQGKLDKCDPSL